MILKLNRYALACILKIKQLKILQSVKIPTFVLLIYSQYSVL